MKTIVTAPNYVYIVQSQLPRTARVHETFSIEQFISNPQDRKERERVYSQVQARLDELHGQTGLIYDLVYWASPERAYGLYPEAKPELG